MKRCGVIGSLLAVLMLLCGMLTACREPSPVVIQPVDEEDAYTAPPMQTIPEGKMGFMDLMDLNGGGVAWSRFAMYEHTLIDETTAEFEVLLNIDLSVIATLCVTFDAATDTVSQASVSYKDVTVDLMIDNDGELIPLLAAMEGDSQQ